MAEELRVIWVGDGGGSSGRQTNAGPLPQAPGTPPSDGRTQRQGESGPTRGPSAKSGIGDLLANVANLVGFGRLYSSVKELIDGFSQLNRQIDELTGRTAQRKPSEGPQERPRAEEAQPPTPPSAGPPVRPEDDFIEGEFEVKKTTARGLTVPRPSLGPPAPAAVSGVVEEGAVATRGAAATAIEGELVSASAAAGSSLAGVAAVAIPLTIAIGAVVAAVYAFKWGLNQALSDIQNLEGFSSPLAMANAQSEIRQTMAEMQRAERLGPELAGLADITSRGQDAIYQVQTELLDVFIQYFNEMRPLIEATIVAARLTAAAIPALKEQFDVFVAISTNQFFGLWKEIKEAGIATAIATAKMNAILEDNQKDDAVNDPAIDAFFRGLGMAGNPPAPPPAPPAPPGPPPGGGGMF